MKKSDCPKLRRKLEKIELVLRVPNPWFFSFLETLQLALDNPSPPNEPGAYWRLLVIAWRVEKKRICLLVLPKIFHK